MSEECGPTPSMPISTLTPAARTPRNRRTASENAQILKDFKDGRLDVLINVRMLTEGTDVPDVQTVFLTRQTTSRILLTQMVGRGLRGGKFGGTEKAYIVSFIDAWTHRIDWAAYDPLSPGIADDSSPDYGKRPPVQLVSVDLVRRLSAQMDSGNNTNPAPYKTFLPAGWYLAEYSAARSDEEQVEPVRRLVMVFDHEKEQYERLISALLADKLESFQDETVHLDDARQGAVVEWKKELFPDESRHVGSGLEGDLFALARHVAQNREAPRFFEFKQRDEHDLDAIASGCLSARWDDLTKRDRLFAEFGREDRYWKVLYNDFPFFKSAFDACVNRLLFEPDSGENSSHDGEGIINPVVSEEREPADEIKAQVNKRDRSRCLCCGDTRKLRVDHIKARYFGGGHELDNLQTSCEACNLTKSINGTDFRTKHTTLTSPFAELPAIRPPQESEVGESAAWEMFLRRSINFYFRCSAVDHIEIRLPDDERVGFVGHAVEGRDKGKTAVRGRLTPGGGAVSEKQVAAARALIAGTRVDELRKRCKEKGLDDQGTALEVALRRSVWRHAGREKEVPGGGCRQGGCRLEGLAFPRQ